MDEHHIIDEDTEDTSIDSVRRRLLKIGIYSVPAIIFLGKVKEAHASGTSKTDWDNKHYNKKDSKHYNKKDNKHYKDWNR